MPSSDLSTLDEIFEPDCSIRHLRRRFSEARKRELQLVAACTDFERKLTISSKEQLADLVAPLPAELQSFLLADMQSLADWFGERASRRPFVASLTLTRGDECRKFHVDWIELRLIVTYFGPGTEWVPHSAIDRAALGRDWSDLNEVNRAIVPNASEVRRARPFDLLVLKGESFPNNAGRGAVHRSPPNAHSGSPRLVFKLTSLSHPHEGAA